MNLEQELRDTNGVMRRYCRMEKPHRRDEDFANRDEQNYDEKKKYEEGGEEVWGKTRWDEKLPGKVNRNTSYF